jgi:hypothetical protein
MCSTYYIKIHSGHRMSEQERGFLKKLWNKLYYEAEKFVDDPKANELADRLEKKEPKKDEEKKVVENLDTENTTGGDTGGNTGDPDKFDAKRLLGKVWDVLRKGVTMLFVPILCIALASLVANDLIVYAPPVRILFFVFTFGVCYFSSFYLILLTFIFLLRTGYSYYVNNMTDGPKRDIMPTMFGILPITTYQPVSALGSFFLFPFRYQKTEEGTIKLKEIMDNYWNDLLQSFPGLNEIDKMPYVVKNLKEAKEKLDHMHDVKSSPTDMNITKNKEPEQEQEQPVAQPEAEQQS